MGDPQWSMYCCRHLERERDEASHELQHHTQQLNDARQLTDVDMMLLIHDSLILKVLL